MFFDTDCGGVVHNLAYLRMIETCRTRLAGQMGMDLPGMLERKIFPAVIRIETDYKRPAKLGEWLTVHGWLESLQRARFVCCFEMHRESDSTLLVTARQTLALIQLPEGRPVRLPGEWRKWR